MTIRLAKLSDYEELMKLYDLFVQTDKYTQYNNDSFEKVLRDSNSFVYVADDKSKLLGFATFCIRNVVRNPKPIMQLEECRKKGIGRKFTELLEKKSKELNCNAIYIESRIDLEPAHRFYENLGYKKSGYYFKKII